MAEFTIVKIKCNGDATFWEVHIREENGIEAFGTGDTFDEAIQNAGRTLYTIKYFPDNS